MYKNFVKRGLWFILWGACLALCPRVPSAFLALWSARLGKRESWSMCFSCICLFILHFFSFSWWRGLAADSDCGTPRLFWTFFIQDVRILPKLRCYMYLDADQFMDHDLIIFTDCSHKYFTDQLRAQNYHNIALVKKAFTELIQSKKLWIFFINLNSYIFHKVHKFCTSPSI